MHVQSLAWRTDLAVLGLAGSTVHHRSDHADDQVVVSTPDNPAYRWGNFLLLPRAPGHDDVPGLVESFREALPHATHRAFGIEDPHAPDDAAAALADAGYDVERSSVLTATAIQPPPRPNAHAAVRTLQTDDDWAQRVELDLVMSPGSGAAFEEFSRRRALAERRLVTGGHARWFGAFDGGRLLSALGVVATGDGLVRYQEVMTRPEARGQGLAGTLVHAAGQHALAEMGGRTLVIVAAPDEGAIRIYRSVGFTDTEVQVRADLAEA